jgi:hypothetical protein
MLPVFGGISGWYKTTLNMNVGFLPRRGRREQSRSKNRFCDETKCTNGADLRPSGDTPSSVNLHIKDHNMLKSKQNKHQRPGGI